MSAPSRGFRAIEGLIGNHAIQEPHEISVADAPSLVMIGATLESIGASIGTAKWGDRVRHRVMIRGM